MARLWFKCRVCRTMRKGLAAWAKESAAMEASESASSPQYEMVQADDADAEDDCDEIDTEGFDG